MKQFFLITFLIVTLTSQAQKFRDGKGFNSVFKSATEGIYKGTVNGVLFCTIDGEEIILDFQGSKADLTIVPDPDEVYDSNTKVYSGQTTSGKTSVTYSTYAWANEISVKLSDEEFELTAIDGASHMVINGIDYYYQAEQGTEYLVLEFTSNLQLSNWQRLVRNTDETRNISELKKKKRNLTINTNSTLTFAIKR